MEILQSYTLKLKIAQLYQVSPPVSGQISDLVGKMTFILENPDLYIDAKKIEEEELERLTQEYNQILDKILSLEPQEIIQKLQGKILKNSNFREILESMKYAFIH